MPSISLLLVLSSGLAHAVWNLFTKKSQNKMAFLWLITLPISVILLPVFVHDLMRASLSGMFVTLLLLSFLCQCGYTLMMSKAYTFGDISQVYPIMRGTGTLLIPLCSALFFHEYLSVLGWLGIGCIVCGVFAISGVFRRRGVETISFHPAALWYAFGVGICITGYTLVDKQIVQQFSPFGLLEIGNIAALIVTTLCMRDMGLIKAEWRLNWRPILVGAVLSPGSYLLFLFAMKLASLATIAPIREVSTVFGTLFGILLLKERQRLWRLVMSSVITTGIIFIAMWG